MQDASQLFSYMLNSEWKKAEEEVYSLIDAITKNRSDTITATEIEAELGRIYFTTMLREFSDDVDFVHHSRLDNATNKWRNGLMNKYGIKKEEPQLPDDASVELVEVMNALRILSDSLTTYNLYKTNYLQKKIETLHENSTELFPLLLNVHNATNPQQHNKEIFLLMLENFPYEKIYIKHIQLLRKALGQMQDENIYIEASTENTKKIRNLLDNFNPKTATATDVAKTWLEIRAILQFKYQEREKSGSIFTAARLVLPAESRKHSFYDDWINHFNKIESYIRSDQNEAYTSPDDMKQESINIEEARLLSELFDLHDAINTEEKEILSENTLKKFLQRFHYEQISPVFINEMFTLLDQMAREIRGISIKTDRINDIQKLLDSMDGTETNTAIIFMQVRDMLKEKNQGATTPEAIKMIKSIFRGDESSKKHGFYIKWNNKFGQFEESVREQSHKKHTK